MKKLAALLMLLALVVFTPALMGCSGEEAPSDEPAAADTSE